MSFSLNQTQTPRGWSKSCSSLAALARSAPVSAWGIAAIRSASDGLGARCMLPVFHDPEPFSFSTSQRSILLRRNLHALPILIAGILPAYDCLISTPFPTTTLRARASSGVPVSQSCRASSRLRPTLFCDSCELTNDFILAWRNLSALPVSMAFGACMVMRVKIWRREWDSDSPGSNGMCKLRILKCARGARCARCAAS
jgi:hypothetical protein